MPTNKTLQTLDNINLVIERGIPVLSLAFGALNLVRELIERRRAGQSDMTDKEFFAKVDIMHDGGAQLIANADAWFAANPGLNPATGKKRRV